MFIVSSKTVRVVRLILNAGLLIAAIVMNSVPSSAQDEQDVFRSIEMTVCAVQPALKRELQIIETHSAVYGWKSKEMTIVITVNTRPTVEQTRMDFESEPEVVRIHGGIDIRVLEKKVDGLGDDNYMWEEANGKEKLLAFRTGTYQVCIWAPSFEISKSIAQSISYLIPALTISGLERTRLELASFVS